AQTARGADRYSLVEHFRNTSNPATGSAGVMDYAPTGAPFFLGAGPTVPTGGGPLGLTASAFAALFAHSGQANGSMADPLVRDNEAAGILRYVLRHDLSRATTMASPRHHGHRP